MKIDILNKLMCLVCGLLLIGSSIFATVDPIIWQKSYGGTGSEAMRKIIRTSDGGYAMIGYGENGSGDITGGGGGAGALAMWVVKVNQAGTIEWQKPLGGTFGEDGSDIIQTSDGGYLVIGNGYSSDGDVTATHIGDSDAWVVKLASNGTVQWNKCYGGFSEDLGKCIVPIGTNGYMLGIDCWGNGGAVSDHSAGYDADILLVRIDINGNVIWTKCIKGSGGEFVETIIPTSDNKLMLVGQTSSNDGDFSGLFHGGGSDAVAAKIDTSGNIIWVKCFGGTNIDYFSGVVQHSNGSFFACGATYSTNGDITSSPHGNSDGWVVNFSSIGALLAQNTLGGTGYDLIKSVKIIFANEIYFCGATASTNGDISSNHGSNDFWLLSLKDNLTLNFSTCFGGTASDGGASFVVNTDGSLTLAGTSSSTNGDVTIAPKKNYNNGNSFSTMSVDNNANGPNSTLSNHGGSDFWAFKFSRSIFLPVELLDFKCFAQSHDKVSVEWSTASESNNDFFTIEKSLNGTDWKIIGNIKGAGNSTRIINYECFDDQPVMGIQYYRLKQTDFDGKFKYSKSVALDFKDAFSFSLYPNPAQPHSSVYLSLNMGPDDEQPIIVVVYDSMGREVLSKVTNIDKNSNGQLTAIDPSNTLSPGVYIISATSDNSMYKQKLIIR